MSWFQKHIVKKLRNYRKQESQTHVEFAHEKEVYFNRWCNSREVGTDFEKLRQVILIEEFKMCVPGDIKTCLHEQKIENLAKAAAYADDYVLRLTSPLLTGVDPLVPQRSLILN